MSTTPSKKSAKSVKKPASKKSSLETKKKKILPQESSKEVLSASLKGGGKELPKKEAFQETALAWSGRYWGAVGRRKTAVAEIRLFTKGEKEILVNKRPYQQYFPTKDLQQTVVDPLVRMKNIEKFRVTAHVSGGGMRGQAEAVRHGIARALVVFNQDFKKRLRRAGFLTRDPRARERKKFGLKSARRAPQWQKR